MRALAWLVVILLICGCDEKTRVSARKTETKSDASAKHAVEATFQAVTDAEAPNAAPEFNTEAYDRVYDNPFQLARQNPLSTFSIDVDTASYSNMRRYLNQGTLPPKDSVRIEELINYFSYDYAPPVGDEPFSAHVEIGPCPWQPQHKLARIGLKGREVPQERRGTANLVFLVDVSGSMNDANKLPLVQSSLRMLVNQLGDNDRVAIAVYAGASGLALPSTPCVQRASILEAIDNLRAGGSTNGGQGIELAYNVALQNLQAEGINRVILCTDGDFNVGITNQGDLIRLIEEKREQDVFLTVLGYGMGNYKDSTLEKLADKGNGNYAYIDTAHEAQKVLVEQLGSTLITIAKDVKIQVDFNPAHVAAYRLVGYENRVLANQDFHDDTKDAGEIGAGHTVTALYELVPPGVEIKLPMVDASKYQAPPEGSGAASDEWLTIKLRYKAPTSDESQLSSFPVKAEDKALADMSSDYRFAAGVACFGMLLRDSEHKGAATFDLVKELTAGGTASDKSGYRSEFAQLVKTAAALTPK